MQRRRPTVLIVTFLSGLLAVGAAPGTVCVSMAECPAMEVGDDCHGSSPAPDHCGQARIERDGDCCGLVEGDALPPTPGESGSPTAENLEVKAVDSTVSLSVVEARRPSDAPDGRTPTSGRSLLSLHQTLLI